MKAPAVLICVALLCSACGAPSLRDKKEINRLVAAQDFTAAVARLDKDKKKLYKEKDAALYFLDKAALLHDAQQPVQSDAALSSAQDVIDELYAKSVTGALGTLLINDLTTPYYAAPYEQALTFFYRGMNFLQLNNLSGALVEARKAVFYLDHLRGAKSSGYRDDAFVQYFASLVFESGGKRDDARISRQNALNAYQRNGWPVPDFPVPPNASEMGEILIFHYNGLLPLLKSQTMQVGWDKLLLWASSPAEGESINPQVQNAIMAGLTGRAITVAYPVLEKQPYQVQASFVTADGMFMQNTQKVQDTSALVEDYLQERMPGLLFRLATRAIVKQTAVVQARHAAAQAAKDDTVGKLAGMFVNFLGALSEKADTRQWFTLPAEVRLARIFVRPGEHEIKLFFKDGYGNIVGEKSFGTVRVRAGERVFLHSRTAK